VDIQKLTIGQMAELNHVTCQTLRHYDKEGLLKPYFVDLQSGYRYYHINQSARLDMIQYLKACGVPLAAIKRQLEADNPKQFYDYLVKQLNAIEDTISLLNSSKMSILRTISNYEKYESLPKDATIFFEYIPERFIYKYTSPNNFFEQDDSGYEMMLRELKKNLYDKNLPPSYFCNVGTIIKKAYLEKKTLFSNEVFVFVDKKSSIDYETEVLSQGMYICLCSDDFYREAEFALELLNKIKNMNYVIVGDYICEVIAEFPAMNHISRKMFYKIQIPVKLK